jgi:hypothetical protein
MATMNEHEEPILQDPIEPDSHMRKNINSPIWNKRQRALEGLRESEDQLFLMTTKYMILKNFK